jgi:hypothetical protein
VLGDAKTRHSGETIGLSFDPSKLVGPGVHLLRATLKDGQGTSALSVLPLVLRHQ